MLVPVLALLVFSYDPLASPTPSEDDEVRSEAGPRTFASSHPDPAGFEEEIQKLRKRRDSLNLIPPLVMMGVGATVVAVTLIVAVTSECVLFCFVAPVVGFLIGTPGDLLLLAGLTWLIVDLVLRGELDGRIGKLLDRLAAEQQSPSASAGRSSGFVVARF